MSARASDGEKSAIAQSLDRLTSPSTSNYDRVRASWDAVPTARIPRTASDDYRAYSSALQAGEQASQLLKELEHQHNNSVAEGFAVADHLRHTQHRLSDTQHEMALQQRDNQIEKETILNDWKADHGGLKQAHDIQTARTLSAERAASELELQGSLMADRQTHLCGALDAAHEHIRSTPRPPVPLWGFVPGRGAPPPAFNRPPPNYASLNHEVEVLRLAALGIQERSRHLTGLYHLGGNSPHCIVIQYPPES